MVPSSDLVVWMITNFWKNNHESLKKRPRKQQLGGAGLSDQGSGGGDGGDGGQGSNKGGNDDSISQKPAWLNAIMNNDSE